MKEDNIFKRAIKIVANNITYFILSIILGLFLLIVLTA